MIGDNSISISYSKEGEVTRIRVKQEQEGWTLELIPSEGSEAVYEASGEDVTQENRDGSPVFSTSAKEIVLEINSK